MIYCLDPKNTHTIVDIKTGYVEYLWKRFLLDNSLVIFDSGFAYRDLNLEKILQNNPHITNIVFDCAANVVEVDNVLGEIKKLNLPKKTFVITSDYSYFKNPQCDPMIKFFPFWAIWTSSPDTTVHSYDPKLFHNVHQFSNKIKKHKISCLNGTPTEHRILTYLHLKDKPYFKDLVFSFGNRPPHHHFGGLLTNEERKAYKSLPNNVSFVTEDAVRGIDISVDHPAFLESYVNLVTETTISNNVCMLSEKTFKPIVTGQFFILIAPPGAVQFLRNIGIDTFDDIIDHSYDTELDLRIRIKLALDQVDHLVQMDLDSLYNQSKSRLIRNSKYFLSQEFREQFKLNFD